MCSSFLAPRGRRSLMAAKRLSGSYDTSAQLGRVRSGASEPKQGLDWRRISSCSRDLKPRDTLSPTAAKRFSGSKECSARLGRVRSGARELYSGLEVRRIARCSVLL